MHGVNDRPLAPHWDRVYPTDEGDVWKFIDQDVRGVKDFLVPFYIAVPITLCDP